MPDGAVQPPGPAGGGPGGHGTVVAVGVIALVLVAFGVFVLPFAFTTPPPIITRFTATHSFSPGQPNGRQVGRVSIRLSEPSRVTITVHDSGGHDVATLANGGLVRARTLSIPWRGIGTNGARAPDGEYTIDLFAQAGEKRFSKSRRIVIDTTAPVPAAFTVASMPTGCATHVIASHEASYVRLVAAGTGTGIGPRPLRAGGDLTWMWDGRGADGKPVSPGVRVIRATSRDGQGNAVMLSRTCWVSHLDASAVPARPGAGDEVGVRIARHPGAVVRLVLRRRVGTPGNAPGAIIAGTVGPAATGPATTTRVRIPPGTEPGGLWLMASTGPGHVALLGLGGGG